jgi:hypothetical protein
LKTEAVVKKKWAKRFQNAIAIALNRTDKKEIFTKWTVIIPADFSGDLEFYLPFPNHVQCIEAIDKIIYFSY